MGLEFDKFVERSLKEAEFIRKTRDLTIEEKVKNSREVLFAALRGRGVTHVSICYSGSGDSGGIDEVLAHNGDYRNISLDEPLEIETDLAMAGKKTVADILEDIVYGFLSAYYGGWENNEGAQGTMLIDVEKKTIDFDHGENVIHVEHHNHEL